MENKRQEKLLDLFEQSLCRRDYLEAMKTVGALYYSCAENAREKEAKLLFLMKDYKRCVSLLKDVSTMTQLENELYVASLAFSQEFENVNRFLDGESKIGHCCSCYVQKYMNGLGHKLISTYKVCPEQDVFFQKLLLRDIAQELVSIYTELEDAKIMRGGGIDTTEIVSSCLSKIKNVPIADMYLDHIKGQIEANGYFDSNLITAFIYIYLGEVNKSTSVMRVFKELDDIIFYLDLERKINPRQAELTTVGEYLDTILSEVNKGNPIVGIYLKELYTTSILYGDLKINDEDMLCTVWKKELGKNFPAFLENADNQIFDNEVRNILSDKAKVAYDAAAWQYKVTIEEEYGIRDAGMLCLSYMRIIELEMNNIFITVLRAYGTELRNIYEVKKSNLRGGDKSEFINKWKICIDGIDVNCADENGFTLEKLWFLFINLSTHRDRKNNGVYDPNVNNEDDVSQKCKEILGNVLNEAGIKAVESGRCADMIEYDIRNKYRNPPAHTRYVCKETAFECKSYVETVLLELYSYVL